MPETGGGLPRRRAAGLVPVRERRMCSNVAV